MSSLKLPGPQPSSLIPWELGSDKIGWGGGGGGGGQLMVTQPRAFLGDVSQHVLGATATLPPSSEACQGRSHPIVGWPQASARLLFFLPQRVPLSGNKGHQGIKEDMGGGQGTWPPCLQAGSCSHLHSRQAGALTQL